MYVCVCLYVCVCIYIFTAQNAVPFNNVSQNRKAKQANFAPM